jgi:hypothetical protein
MNVSTQPWVISQVPPIVVWVLIDDDVVTVPLPVVDEGVIVRCNAKEEPVKIKPLSVSSLKPQDMVAAEAASEAAVFEWMIDAVVGIVTAGIMSYPPVVCLNVGNFPVFSLPLLPVRLLNSRRSGTMSRNMSTSKTRMPTAMLPAAMSAAMLPAATPLHQTSNNKHQKNRKNSDSGFHATPPNYRFACQGPKPE